jgi:purine-binding chemotaxis protein CheW
MSSLATPHSVASLRGKYLTVVLDNQGYGLAVQKVREIIRMQAITLVPQLPDFVKGVINLRGRVIPVIDLRLKFSLPAVVSDRTCVIVVQVTLPSGLTVQMGLVVDSVEEVVTLNDVDLEPTPEFGVKVSTSYLIGMAKVKGQVKTLLNVDRIVSPETVESIVQATNTPFSTLTEVPPTES